MKYSHQKKIKTNQGSCSYDQTTSSQEIQWKEKHVRQHHWDVFCKIYKVGNITGQYISLKNNFQQEKKGDLVKKIQTEKNKTFVMYQLPLYSDSNKLWVDSRIMIIKEM